MTMSITRGRLVHVGDYHTSTGAVEALTIQPGANYQSLLERSIERLGQLGALAESTGTSLVSAVALSCPALQSSTDGWADIDSGWAEAYATAEAALTEVGLELRAGLARSIAGETKSKMVSLGDGLCQHPKTHRIYLSGVIVRKRVSVAGTPRRASVKAATKAWVRRLLPVGGYRRIALDSAGTIRSNGVTVQVRVAESIAA